MHPPFFWCVYKSQCGDDRTYAGKAFGEFAVLTFTVRWEGDRRTLPIFGIRIF